MKKVTALLLALTMVFALAACGGGSGGDGKTWPDTDYLTASEKYTGAGNITQTSVWDNEDITVDINGATDASVSEYISKLESAGWKQIEDSPTTTDEQTNYGLIKDGHDSFIEVAYFKAAKTEELSTGNYSYNLSIMVDKDGGELYE